MACTLLNNYDHPSLEEYQSWYFGAKLLHSISLYSQKLLFREVQKNKQQLTHLNCEHILTETVLPIYAVTVQIVVAVTWTSLNHIPKL